MINKQRLLIALFIGLILLLPLITGAPWTVSDYVIAAGLLITAGGLFDWLTTLARERKNKILLGAGVIIFTVYIWAELAVGIFTDLGS